MKGRSLVQFDLTMQGGIEEPSGADFKQYLKSRIHGSEMAPAVNPAPDGSRLKTKVIADPNETAGVPIRRQEPSARTSLQGCFRRGEIIER